MKRIGYDIPKTARERSSAVKYAFMFVMILSATFSCAEERIVIHVFVALADNEHQGIIPVPAALGDGDNPQSNLYWGARYGVKTFFHNQKNWTLLSSTKIPAAKILERCIFKYNEVPNVFMIADAYQGIAIADAIGDFLTANSGEPSEIRLTEDSILAKDSQADLLVYVGHDGLMDFPAPTLNLKPGKKGRPAIVLACASLQYFRDPLSRAGAIPLLLTTNLMAPEAYTLAAALEGWIKKEKQSEIRLRAAKAYSSYQHCSLQAALGLFAQSP